MKLSLKAKILGSLLLVSSLMFVVAGTAYLSSNKLSAKYHEYPDNIIPTMTDLGNFKFNLMTALYRVMQLTLPNNPAEEQDRLVKKIKEGLVKSDEDWKRLNQGLTEVEVPKYKKMGESYETLKKHIESALQLLEKPSPENVAKVADLYRGQASKDRHQFYADLDEVVKLHQEEVKTLETEANASEQQTNKIILFTTGFGFLFALFFGFFTSNRVNKSISGLTASLKDSSEQVTQAIGQLAQSGNLLSNLSTESASAVESTVIGLDELTAMVKINSDNAQQAASLSITSRDAAEQSDVQMKKLVALMDEISNSSRKIEEIIHVIDDIAFQTNLLALNAAVEAARAGEQGKGFAVVADAVRSLAQRSADAAKDITQLIKQSVEQIERGTKSVHQNGESLGQIVINVKKVSDLNNEIAAASQEQANGLSQISVAMAGLDKSSQTNAATAEEIAASTTEVSSQMVRIHEDVVSINEFIFAKNTGNHEVAKPEGKPEVKAHSSPKKAKEVKASKKTSAVVHAKKEEAHHEEKHEPAKKVASSEAASTIPFDDDDDGRGGFGSVENF